MLASNFLNKLHRTIWFTNVLTVSVSIKLTLCWLTKVAAFRIYQVKRLENFQTSYVKLR